MPPQSAFSDAERQALRQFHFSQKPRPSQRALISWFEENHGRKTSQSTVSELLSGRYKHLSNRPLASKAGCLRQTRGSNQESYAVQHVEVDSCRLERWRHKDYNSQLLGQINNLREIRRWGGPCSTEGALRAARGGVASCRSGWGR